MHQNDWHIIRMNQYVDEKKSSSGDQLEASTLKTYFSSFFLFFLNKVFFLFQ